MCCDVIVYNDATMYYGDWELGQKAVFSLGSR